MHSLSLSTSPSKQSIVLARAQPAFTQCTVACHNMKKMTTEQKIIIAEAYINKTEIELFYPSIHFYICLPVRLYVILSICSLFLCKTCDVFTHVKS